MAKHKTSPSGAEPKDEGQLAVIISPELLGLALKAAIEAGLDEDAERLAPVAMTVWASDGPQKGEALALAAEKGGERALQALLDAPAAQWSVKELAVASFRVYLGVDNRIKADWNLARTTDANPERSEQKKALWASWGGEREGHLRALIKAGARPEALFSQNEPGGHLDWLTNFEPVSLWDKLMSQRDKGRAMWPIEMLDLWMELGADVNQKIKGVHKDPGRAETPLFMAVSKQSSRDVEWLLRQGADPAKKCGNWNQSPLELATALSGAASRVGREREFDEWALERLTAQAERLALDRSTGAGLARSPKSGL